MNILDLPCSVLMQIFENLSYEEVSKMRLVCQHIDQVCQSVLNSGFSKVIRQHSIASKRIKALLPRRESERRNHFLARHADILTSVETRISMLTMTYTKYMDLGMCCFIPGRVLDEIFRILRLISVRGNCLRPHEVLQELRDISSMAIEHFEEKIAGAFKKQIEENSVKARAAAVAAVVNNANTSPSSSCGGLEVGSPTFNSDRDVNVQIVANKQYLCRLVNLGQPSMNYLVVGSGNNAVPVNIADISASSSNANTSGLPDVSGGEKTRCSVECSGKKTIKTLKKEFLKMKKRFRNQQNLSRVMQRRQLQRLQRMTSVITNLNGTVADLKKRVDENDAKNRELIESIRQLNSGEETTITSQSSGESQEVTNPGNPTVNPTNSLSTCVDNAVAIGSTNMYSNNALSKPDCQIIVKNNSVMVDGSKQHDGSAANRDGRQVKVVKRKLEGASEKNPQEKTEKKYKRK